MEDTIFGKCPVCGNDGGDAPRTDLTGADAGYIVTSDGSSTDVRTVANSYKIDETGNGVILAYYKGRLMCEVCKNRLDADEESIRSAEKHAESEQFRQSVGFKTEID